MAKIAMAALLLGLLAPSPGAADDTTREQREALRRYRSGQQALTNERYQEAVTEFEAAIRLDPVLVLAHYGLGQAHMALKDYKGAVRAYTRCEQAFHEQVGLAATDRMAAEKRLDDVIKALEDDLQYMQRVAQGSNASAQRAQQATMTKEQQIHTLKTRRNNRTIGGPEPTPGWLSLALGSAYFRDSDLVRAEESYKKAIVVDPRLGEAHSNLAVVYLLTGRPSEAEGAIEAAEKAGFQVNPKLKKDVAARTGPAR